MVVRPGKEALAKKHKAMPLVYDGTIRSTEGWQIAASTETYVIHAATYFLAKHKPADIDSMIDSNIAFGVHLLEWLSSLQHAVLISLGSFSQFRDGQRDSQNLYVATKNAYEPFLDYYSSLGRTKICSIYMSDTYGPNDPRRKVLNLLIDACREHNHLSLSPGLQELSLLYVDDACSGIVAALQARISNDSGKRLNYSLFASRPYKLIEIGALVEKIVGVSGFLHFGELPYRHNEIMKFVPAFASPPGWNAQTDLEQGIFKLVKN